MNSFNLFSPSVNGIFYYLNGLKGSRAKEEELKGWCSQEGRGMKVEEELGW